MSKAPLARVVVVLGAHADEVRERVPLHGAQPVVCGDWEKGMGNSLRAGIDALNGCDAVVVALGDQPKLSPLAVERLLAQRGRDELAVRATYGGVPGHPVLLERRGGAPGPGRRGGNRARRAPPRPPPPP